MSRYLLPRHLGGTKWHPRQQITDEERYAAKHRYAENDRLRAAQTAQRAAEKRARQYQLEDEQLAFDRQQELADQEFRQRQALLGQEFGGRFALQEGDIAGRYGLQGLEGQQRLEQAQQGFGFQQALGAQNYGYDLGLGEQRIGGQMDLARLGGEITALRDETLHDYDVFDKEIDFQNTASLSQYDAILKDWYGERRFGEVMQRDASLFNNEKVMQDILDGYQTIRDFRNHGWDLDKTKTLHENAVELRNLDGEWQGKVARLTNDLAREGIMTDQFFQSQMYDVTRGEEERRRGLKYLPKKKQEELDRLEESWQDVLSDDTYSIQEKEEAVAKIAAKMARICNGARPMPADKRQKSLHEMYQANILEEPDGGRLQLDPDTGKFEGIRNDSRQQTADPSKRTNPATGRTPKEEADARAKVRTAFRDRVQELYDEMETDPESQEERRVRTYPEAQAMATREFYDDFLETGILAGPPSPEVAGPPGMAGPDPMAAMKAEAQDVLGRAGMTPVPASDETIRQRTKLGQSAVPPEAVPEHARDADPFMQNYKMGLSLIPQMSADQAEKELGPGAIYRNEKGELKRVPQAPTKKPFQTWDIR